MKTPRNQYKPCKKPSVNDKAGHHTRIRRKVIGVIALRGNGAANFIEGIWPWLFASLPKELPVLYQTYRV